MGLLFTYTRAATKIREDRAKVVDGLLEFIRHYDLFRQYEASSLVSGVKTIDQHLDHCEWLKKILSAELDQLLATKEYQRFCNDRDADWETFEESLAREVAVAPPPEDEEILEQIQRLHPDLAELKLEGMNAETKVALKHMFERALARDAGHHVVQPDLEPYIQRIIELARLYAHYGAESTMARNVRTELRETGAQLYDSTRNDERARTRMAYARECADVRAPDLEIVALCDAAWSDIGK